TYALIRSVDDVKNGSIECNTAGIGQARGSGCTSITRIRKCAIAGDRCNRRTGEPANLVAAMIRKNQVTTGIECEAPRPIDVYTESRSVRGGTLCAGAGYGGDLLRRRIHSAYSMI